MARTLRVTRDDEVDATNPIAGDIYLDGTGDFVRVDGAEAVRIAIDNRLSLQRGEWFLDTADGFPWYEDVLTGRPSGPAIREAVRKVLLDTPGVAEVVSLTVTADNATRTLDIDFVVQSDDGDVIDFSTIAPVTVEV